VGIGFGPVNSRKCRPAGSGPESCDDPTSMEDVCAARSGSTAHYPVFAVDLLVLLPKLRDDAAPVWAGTSVSTQCRRQTCGAGAFRITRRDAISRGTTRDRPKQRKLIKLGGGRRESLSISTVHATLSTTRGTLNCLNCGRHTTPILLSREIEMATRGRRRPI
jgi:hypothetical protein